MFDNIEFHTECRFQILARQNLPDRTMGNCLAIPENKQVIGQACRVELMQDRDNAFAVGCGPAEQGEHVSLMWRIKIGSRFISQDPLWVARQDARHFYSCSLAA